MTVYLYAPDGKSPENHKVTGRVQSYVLDITECSYIAIENLNFWATTFKAESTKWNKLLKGLNITSNIFKYFTTSRRMLGLAVIPDRTIIDTNKNWVDVPNYVFNNTFQYSDGLALYTNTKGSVYKNNLFEYNDWTGCNSMK